MAPSAGAQALRPDSGRARELLGRCTSVPDEAACRALLRLRIPPRERSLALTYLAETGAEPRDSFLTAAVKLDSSNALAQYALGRTSAANRLQHLMTALALRPDWTRINRIAAQQYSPGTNPVDTAVIVWRRVALAEPNDAEAQALYAKALVYAKQLSEAEGVYRRALALQPDLPAAAGGLCYTLLQLGKEGEAQAPCSRAISGWDGDHGWDLGSIAYTAELAKDFPLALAAAQAQLASWPSWPALLDVSRVLRELKRDAQADSLLRAYVAAHPNDHAAVVGAAGELYASGDLQLARTLYLRALGNPCAQLDIPCYARGDLAVASLRLGQLEDAFRYLGEALAREADCPGTVAAFRKYAAARPDSAAVLARLRALLQEVGARVATGDAARAGDYFASIGEWARAAQLYGVARDTVQARERAGQHIDRPDVRWRYGQALLESGRYCEALRALTEARTAAPGSGGDELAQALERAQGRCKEDSR